MLKQAVYIFICLLFIIAQSIVFYQIFPFSFGIFLIDNLIQAILCVGCTWLLWKLMAFGNLDALPVFQRIINYAVLGIVLTILSVLCSYALLDWTSKIAGMEEISKVLWLKSFASMLIYLLIVQFTYYQNKKVPKEPDNKQEIIVENEKSTDSEVKEILERVAIKNGQKIDLVPVNEIFYLQADGDYVKIFTDKHRYLKEETMKFFQEHLPEKMFVRTHRSYIVNVEKIQRINTYEKQSQIIILKNGDKIKASSTGYKQLKANLNL